MKRRNLEWIAELPPNIIVLFLVNLIKDDNIGYLLRKRTSIRTCIYGGFSWDLTKEGCNFWYKIANYYDCD